MPTKAATTVPQLTTEETHSLANLAAQLRVDSIRMSTEAGSGHPTSSMSAADLLAVLIQRYFRYDWGAPDNRGNDRLVFSKGHASPLLYSVFKAVGVASDDEVMTGYRQFENRLQGHPTPVLPWVEVATGSLGQGLPDAVGIALAGRYLDRLPYRVWVLCGDSEMAEGSMWEALDKASHYDLGNLVAIVYVNRLGQRGATDLGWDLDAYARRAETFGAQVFQVDGHDLRAIDEAFAAAAESTGTPVVVLAETVKGKGVPEIEDSPDWHGKPLPDDMAERAVAELGGVTDLRVTGPAPVSDESGESGLSGENAADRNGGDHTAARAAADVTYELGEEVATRKAYGEALVAIGRSDDRVVVLDGEVSNSTYANLFAEEFPDRFFEMFIAEQQLVAAATGLATRGYIPFASTFGAFLTRAYDFIRMAPVSEADIRLMGSHAGVEIGADGPSQMALEDLAMMRAIPGATVLYPADATSTVALTAEMAGTPGVSYLRTTRGAYPVLYPSDERFPIGGSKTLRSSPDDRVTLVGAGVTLHECLKAADDLAGEDIAVRVIDCYSVKPIDSRTLTQAVADTDGRIVVVEDHHPEGGLGEAVLSALVADGAHPRAVSHLAVDGVPGSGTGEELLAWAGIDAAAIATAVRRLVGPAAA